MDAARALAIAVLAAACGGRLVYGEPGAAAGRGGVATGGADGAGGAPAAGGAPSAGGAPAAGGAFAQTGGIGGQACAAGECEPKLIATANADQIVVDATHVYFTDGSGVTKVPIGGGRQELLGYVPYGLPRFGMAVDAQFVYTVDSGSTVYEVPIAGGPAVVLATGPGPKAVARDGAYLYYTTMDMGGIWRLTLAHPTSEALVSHVLWPSAIAVDRGDIYWLIAGGGVTTMPVAGGTPAVVRPASKDGAFEMALDASNVYLTHDRAGIVTKTPRAGGESTTIASGQNHPQGVAADGTYVYWVNTWGGTVMRVAVSGGTPTVLASGQDGPYAIAVDAKNVYWTNLSGDGGSVMRRAKP